VKKLETQGLHPKFHQLDIVSLESLNMFAKYLREKYGGLDILVNNAGTAYKVGILHQFSYPQFYVQLLRILLSACSLQGLGSNMSGESSGRVLGGGGYLNLTLCT
jgi:NAD(P)-dependent dehydrogenase (short-subunit alcohol dehydrogenase family)